MSLAKNTLNDVMVRSSRSLYQISRGLIIPLSCLRREDHPPPPARPSPMRKHRPQPTYTNPAGFWAEIRTPVSDTIETTRQ